MPLFIPYLSFGPTSMVDPTFAGGEAARCAFFF